MKRGNSDSRPAAGRRGALPMTPTSLVGRQRELAAVKSLLAPARLVTLPGPAA
jgi:hypothetical protein